MTGNMHLDKETQMIRDGVSYPARSSIFHTPFSYPEGKNGELKTFNFELSPGSKRILQHLHQLCGKRVDLGLPAVNAPLSSYEELHKLDQEIAQLAMDAPKELQELLSSTTSGVLVGNVRQVQAVWQSYFLANPVRM